jgi:hypothetical protein
VVLIGDARAAQSKVAMSDFDCRPGDPAARRHGYNRRHSSLGIVVRWLAGGAPVASLDRRERFPPNRNSARLNCAKLALFFIEEELGVRTRRALCGLTK